MTSDDRQDAEARAAEIRAEVAATAERRAEEEVAKAHDEVEKAQKRQEKLSRKEREAEERAARAADEVERLRSASATEPRVAAPTPASDAPTGLAQRPEVMAGAAFAGAFVLARVLKRLFD